MIARVLIFSLTTHIVLCCGVAMLPGDRCVHQIQIETRISRISTSAVPLGSLAAKSLKVSPFVNGLFIGMPCWQVSILRFGQGSIKFVLWEVFCTRELIAAFRIRSLYDVVVVAECIGVGHHCLLQAIDCLGVRIAF